MVDVATLYAQNQQSLVLRREREQALQLAQERLQQQEQEQIQQTQQRLPEQTKYEGDLADYNAYETARKLYMKGFKFYNFLEGKEKEYLKEMVKLGASEKIQQRTQPQLNEEVIKRIEAQTGIKIDREKVRESITRAETSLGYKIKPIDPRQDYNQADIAKIGGLTPKQFIQQAQQQEQQTQQPSFRERLGQAFQQDSYGQGIKTLFPPRQDYNQAERTIPERFLDVGRERLGISREQIDTRRLKQLGLEYTPENVEKVRYAEYLESQGVIFNSETGQYERVGGIKGATGLSTEEFLLLGIGAAPRAVIGGTIREVVAGERIIKNPLEVSGKVSFEPLRPTEAISGEPVYTIGQPLERFSYTDPLTGKLIVQERYNVLGLNKEVVSEGRKTIIKANAGSRGRVIYEGIPTDKKGYQDAIKFLEKQGYTKTQAKEIIRLRRPQVQESYFTGQGVSTIPEEGKTTFSLTGREKVLASKGQTGGIDWLQKEGQVRFLTSAGEESGGFFKVVSEQEKAYLKGGKYPYTKLRQQGKIKDTFEGLVGSIEVKTYPESNVIQYKELEVSRKMIPKERIPSVSTAKVFVKQGEPLWSIEDVSIGERRGFTGGGRKSSQQFLENLYKTDNLATSTILGLEKVKVPKPTRTIKIPKAPQVLNVNIPKPIVLPRVEQTRVQEVPFKSQPSELNQVWGQGTIPSEITLLLDRLDEGTRQKIKTETKGRFDIGEILGLNMFEAQGFKPVEIFKEAQKTRQDIRQVQPSLQRQEQFLSQLFRQVNIQRPRQTREPTRPRPPRPPIRPVMEKFLSLPKEQKDEVFGDFFEVYGRRKKKDILLARKGTLSEAELELRKFLTGTLGASGQIKRQGKPLKIDLGFQYRPAKKESTRVVQRRKYRLGTRAEVSEIKQARKLKSFWGFK